MPFHTYSKRPAERRRALRDGSYVDQNDRTFVSMLDPAGNVCEVMVNTNRGMDGGAKELTNVDHGYRAVMTGEMTQNGWLPIHPPVGMQPEEWKAKIEKETAERRAKHLAAAPVPNPTEMEMATAAVAQLRADLIEAKKKATGAK